MPKSNKITVKYANTTAATATFIICIPFPYIIKACNILNTFLENNFPQKTLLHYFVKVLKTIPKSADWSVFIACLANIS